MAVEGTMDTRFNFSLSWAEKRVADVMAKDEYMSTAAFIRKLIRDEAAARGMWPPLTSKEEDNDAHA